MLTQWGCIYWEGVARNHVLSVMIGSWPGNLAMSCSCFLWSKNGYLKNTWPFLVVESERRGGKYSRGDDDNDNDNDGDNDNDDDNDDDDYDDDDDDEDPIEFHPLPPRQLT